MAGGVKRKAIQWAQQLAKEAVQEQQQQQRQQKHSKRELQQHSVHSVVTSMIEPQGEASTSIADGSEEASPGYLEENPDEDLGDLSLPSDTLVAIKLICSQFPVTKKASVRPFVLQSQLYTSVEDRTAVDQELEVLRHDGVVRTFKLATGKDDYAVMLMEDYQLQVEASRRRLEAGGGPHVGDAVAAFLLHVVPTCSSVGISMPHL
eukprot:jgi/Mesen1/3762/ME000205S03025